MKRHKNTKVKYYKSAEIPALAMKNLSIKLQLSLSAIAVGFVLLLAQLVLQFYVLRVDIVHRKIGRASCRERV